MLALFLFLASLLSATSSSSTPPTTFHRCFSNGFNNQSRQVLIPASSSRYSTILNSSIRDLRFINASKKPTFIVVPFEESHVQAAVICAKHSGLQVRTRSGGHDYEGLSYTSHKQFVLIDLSRFKSIEIDINNETAWVETGATLGEFYYEIAKKSLIHGFPAGTCPTVGVGGHLSGGGFGTMFRKYGLAADTVVDARIVDVNGDILDRKSMGEDLFWAIRGGGGASFGVILSWKVRLVPVPETVTVFEVTRTPDRNGGSKLFQKWENVSHNLHQDIFLHTVIKVSKNRAIQLSFTGLYLGRMNKFLTLMNESFPELGLAPETCQEVTWIQSVMYFANFDISDSTNQLLNRTSQFKGFSKAKSDYVEKPISESGLKGLFRRVLEQDSSMLILTPYGGRMSEISDSETPFPHRKGYIYKIQYIVAWDEEEETEEKMRWIRELYGYMTRYVSKSPRAAYYNYRDLDLGWNWGVKYFKGNFDRLVKVKSLVDPENFFRNEQSIPVLS
ncbi:Tetrahydroberberine oxidase [Linum grandiflorum]